MFPIRDNQSTGIYVHFPYCIQKCHYCDFYSQPLEKAGGELSVPADFLKGYTANIKAELAFRRAAFKDFERVNTVYFGGGTASLMPAQVVGELLEAFRASFTFTDDVEISLEGNPENFTPEYLRELHALGVTRVNSGVQTFNGDFLRDMNRYYNQEKYDAILDTLTGSPIPNTGVDLIYGFAGQTKDDFLQDLDRVLQAPVNHLSVYSLTVEPGSKYALNVKKQLQKSPDEDLQDLLFDELPDILGRRDFQMYEISNFAKAGGACRHNLRYWLYEPYLALGPGAHGFTGTERYENMRNVEGWSAKPTGAPLFAHDPVIELPLNLLRLAVPFSVNIFQDVFSGATEHGEELMAVTRRMLEQWVEQGFGDFPESGRFQWKASGYFRLNDRVVELTDALEAVGE